MQLALVNFDQIRTSDSSACLSVRLSLSATVFLLCHATENGNRGRGLLRWCPKHTGCNLGVHRQAKVSPQVHNRLSSRSLFDMGRTVFRLPAELIVEILTYFGDPRHNILSRKVRAGTILNPEHVERLTVIRKLTMTCWHLRNMLFPLLWKYVEGCDISYRCPVPQSPGSDKMVFSGNGLYAQSVYLLLNPTVGAYVQCVYSCIHRLSFNTHEVPLRRALSADLRFTRAPKDLMTKFVNCLVQLPNLRTLEILSSTHIGPITRALKRKCARFPNIRELGISNNSAKFVGSCPNVEAVTATGGLSLVGAKILSSYGKGLERLKRVVGVEEGCVQLGRLRCTLVGGTRSLTVHCGSCAGPPGPPGDLYQGYNRDLPHVRCESLC